MVWVFAPGDTELGLWGMHISTIISSFAISFFLHLSYFDKFFLSNSFSLLIPHLAISTASHI
jgi:hypothetical protein